MLANTSSSSNKLENDNDMTNDKFILKFCESCSFTIRVIILLSYLAQF